MMRKRVLSLAGVALTAACALPPQGVSQQDIALYDAAAVSVGCTMVTEADYLAAEIQTGLTREQLQAITGYKLASGAAQKLPGGGVKLTKGGCA